MIGLRAGADGHLVKGLAYEDLVAAVRSAADGEPVLAPAVARRLIERLRALPDGGLGVRPVRSTLTSREWEVLDLLCAGLSVDDVADRLVLARDTVRTHVKRILRKLGVHSQAEAIEMANGIRATYAPGHREPLREALGCRGGTDGEAVRTPRIGPPGRGRMFDMRGGRSASWCGPPAWRPG